MVYCVFFTTGPFLENHFMTFRRSTEERKNRAEPVFILHSLHFLPNRERLSILPRLRTNPPGTGRIVIYGLCLIPLQEKKG